MAEQKEITSIKGIGQKTLDKLYEAGYTTTEKLETLNVEILKSMGIQSKQINILLETLGITPMDTEIKDLIDKSEDEEFFTRSFQQRYDMYEMITVHKYNMWKCEECGHDVEPRGQILWQDPKTKVVYLRMRTVCRTSCEKRNRLFALKEIEDEGDLPFNFDI